MLSNYLNKNSILLQVNAADWREAVKKSGELLLNTGVCEPRYIQAMIKAVEELGPYMVLAPGIALAHARPEDGVLKVGMAILTLAVPVNFGSPENDPVRLVIAFAGVDHHSHVSMLQELALFLMDENNQEILKSAVDVNMVMSALSTNNGE
jgi:mannitol/fructose-specific phosphotransferase system IIA component (Ntr-type)